MSNNIVIPGKLIQFTYTVTNDDGVEVEKSSAPVAYVAGGNSDMDELVENALAGKRVGDQVDVLFTPEDGGFGEYNPALTMTQDLAVVPEEFRQIGATVQMKNDKGETREFSVSKIEDGKLTLDGNHPYAGTTAHFHITIVAVSDPTDDDLQAPSPDTTH